MSQNVSGRGWKARKLEAHTVDEGDCVFMGINFHGSLEDNPGATYDDELYQSGVFGEVIETPRDDVKAMMEDGTRVVADFAVETSDGTVYRWNVDNGYVIGPVDQPGRPSRSDVGKFGGFYEA